MSLISVTNVEILNNPATFTSPFQFEISFECIAPIQEELEWKLVYVGSAEDEQYDQELDSVLVGPIIVGKNKFVFEAAAPDPSLIPQKDLMEVTVLLLTCSYKEKEFIRIGYYVNNDYPLAETALVEARNAWLLQVAHLQGTYAEAVEALRASGQLTEGPLPIQPAMPPPPPVDVSKLSRNILSDKPRVTRFQIPWDQTLDYAMADEDAAQASADARATEEEAATQKATNGNDESQPTIGDEDEDDEDGEDDENDDEEMDDGEEGEDAEGEEEDEEEEEQKEPVA